MAAFPRKRHFDRTRCRPGRKPSCITKSLHIENEHLVSLFAVRLAGGAFGAGGTREAGIADWKICFDSKVNIIYIMRQIWRSRNRPPKPGRQPGRVRFGGILERKSAWHEHATLRPPTVSGSHRATAQKKDAAPGFPGRGIPARCHLRTPSWRPVITRPRSESPRRAPFSIMRNSGPRRGRRQPFRPSWPGSRLRYAWLPDA